MPISLSKTYRRAARYHLDSQQGDQVDSVNPRILEARKNFAAFCKEMGLPPAKHHLSWHPFLATKEDSACLKGIAGEDVNILSPRGSAKSTVLQLFVAWAIGIHYAPDVKIPIQILYLSYSVLPARKKSEAIKRYLETPKYRRIFPWVVKNSSKWGQEEWELDKAAAGIDPIGSEPYTLLAAGVMGSITSMRSHLIILDDLIKNEASIRNPEVREALAENWNSAITPTLFQGGRCISLGTRFRPDDCHSTLFIPSKGWKLIEQSAILEDQFGNELSYWPEKFSIETLKERRERAPNSFQFQYQNRVVRLTEESIDPEWIQETIVPIEFDQIVLGMDLSSTKKERSDYTVGVLAGKLGNQYYILDMFRGRWGGNISKLDEVLKLLARWGLLGVHTDDDFNTTGYYDIGNTVYMYCDNIAYQSSLEGDFGVYVRDELQLSTLVYRKPKVKGDKFSVFRGITGIFENRLVWFNQYAKLNVLKEELINFGSMPHDDCADACAYALSGLMGARKLQFLDYEDNLLNIA